MTVLTEIRERFLRAIMSTVPAERIAEIHFFAPIKQGGVESGVAVVAAWPESLPDAPPPAESSAPPDDGAPAPEPVAEPPAAEAAPPEPRAPRPVVYTARYRLVLKGPDRGKWETSVVAEADAPLVTVDAVVRGVQRRAGDVEEPTRMEGDEVRAHAEAFTSHARATV